MKGTLITLCFLCILKICVAQQSTDCDVKKITVYSSLFNYKGGANPCYKPAGDSIVYQKNVTNWSNLVLSTQIYIADTAMKGSKCLTCDTALLPLAIRHDKYKGNTEYHPSGNYILFTSENENGVHQPWNLPGAGVNHDIFIMNSTGKQFWRLTNVAAGDGILHPAFSADGTKLFWAELYYSSLFPPKGQEYGIWNMKMADFSIVAGTPQISNIVTFAPRDSVWYESHSFSPDGEYISFTSHQEDSSAILADITIMKTTEIGTTNYINLTNSPNIHDEHSHWSPDGNKISWMSGIFVGGFVTYSSELYLMDSDGANKTRITHFTDSSYPEYIQDTVVTADHYWSPDGRRIFGFVHYTNSSGWPSVLYQVEFKGPCGMQSATPVQENVSEEEGVNIFPNPAVNAITVSLDDTRIEDLRVSLRNLYGQEILLKTVNTKSGQLSVDVSSVPTGIYFLEVFNKSNPVILKKLSILH